MRNKSVPKIKRIITLGSASLLVASPVALAVACGSDVGLIPANDVLINGKTAYDLSAISKSSESKAVSDVFVNQIKYELSEKLYVTEQTSSLSMQTIWLRWDKESSRQSMIKTADEILAMQFASGQPTPEEVDTPEKKLAAIERLSASNFSEQYRELFRSHKNNFDNRKNERTKIDDKIQQITNSTLNYNSPSFTSDFPRILRPLEKEREQQTKIYNDRKTAYIKNYKTEADGLKAWIEALPKNYNGAKTDENAIKYLVDQTIAAKAFGQFQLKINSEFTVEMFNAVDESGQRVFPWFEGTTLTKANEANPPAGAFFAKDPSDKNSKIFFLSKQSNDPGNFAVKSFDTATFGNWNTHARPIRVNHALLPAKRVEGQAFSPWVITQEALTSMLQYYADNSGAATPSLSLLPKVFSNRQGLTQEQNIQLDNSYVDFFGGDPSGKNKGGDLGIDSLTGYVKTMSPGFGLGIVAALNDTAANTGPGSNSADFGLVKDVNVGNALITNLQQRLHTVLQSELNIDNIGTAGQTNAVGQKNTAIAQWVKGLTDDDIKRRFGTIFSEIFRNVNLAYRMTGTDHNNGTYLVVSEYGIHIIKITDLSPGNSLQDALTSDLNKVALAGDVTKVKTNWGDVFTKIYTDRFITKTLINSSADMSALVDALQTSRPELYKEWVEAKYIRPGVGTPNVNEPVSVAVIRMIDDLESNSSITNAEEALGDKISKFITDGIRNRAIASTISPTAVNERVYAELGITNA